MVAFMVVMPFIAGAAGVADFFTLFDAFMAFMGRVGVEPPAFFIAFIAAFGMVKDVSQNV